MELTYIKQKYDIELNLKFNSESTKETYKSALNKYLGENSRVYRMSVNDIKKYMSEFRKRYSDSYYNIMGSCLIILYTKVLNQHGKIKWFSPVNIDRKYHNITSDDEFVKMMGSVSSIKHKFIIIFLYSTGVRLNELINIKLEDVDCINKRVFIKSLKKGKNRHVKLHELTERYLKAYVKKSKPTDYLLNGQGSPKYSDSSVRAIFKRASNGKYSPHSARHFYATNTIEHEDVFFTMEALGHKSLKSTLHYNHIASERLLKSYNPMDKYAN